MNEVAQNFRTLFARYSSIRFLLVGIFNTGFSYFCYAFFIAIGLSIAWASLLALLLGIVWSFVTQGKIVFRQMDKASFVRFVIYWAFIYFVNTEAIYFLVQWKLNAYAAAAVTTVPVTIISYFCLKYLVFRK